MKDECTWNMDMLDLIGLIFLLIFVIAFYASALDQAYKVRTKNGKDSLICLPVDKKQLEEEQKELEALPALPEEVEKKWMDQ